MKVIACVYSHEYGEDLRVFSSQEKADAWKDELGKAYWENKFPDEPMPEENVGTAYFNLQLDRGSEWFIATECEVE